MQSVGVMVLAGLLALLALLLGVPRSRKEWVAAVILFTVVAATVWLSTF